MMKEINFAGDGAYSERNLAVRYNTDLGNDLGNLVLRTLSMIERYFDGRVPEGDSGDVVNWPDRDKVLHAVAEELRRGTLVRLNVPSLTMNQDMMLYAKKNRTLSTTLSHFAEFLKGYFDPKARVR